MLMITASPVDASDKQKKEAEELEEGPMGEAAEDNSPEGLLAQAIEEHGSDDAGTLIEWLREYGYELQPTEEGPAEGAEEEMLEEEPPADGMMDALGEAEAIEEGDDEDDASEDDMEMEEEEFSPGGSLADARRSAASRAFKQHYGAK